ncbi:hypothetical protein M9H77_29654 [Catharanthus roseus]|uniref:Uncharacterized protein n=1 Tax=Catharanthus roseus TaxID=4058 RepID=A0ACB9ZV12_CATRO|nr:hypothetical protein M9H77_29654 [Catharanthus roseus]
MAIVYGGLSRGRLYGASLEATHLRVESSWATTGLLSCSLEVEQRIMRRVEAFVTSVCVAFDEHMRWTLDAMVYSSTPPPPSIDAPGTSTVDPLPPLSPPPFLFPCAL